jgi:hypothetical protein
MRFRLPSAVLLASLAALPFTSPAAAATAEEIDQLVLDGVHSAVQAAVEHAQVVLDDLDPATPLATLDAAIAKAALAATAAATDESRALLGKREAAVRQKIAQFQQKLDKARALLAENTAAPLKINKAIGKAGTTGLKAVGLIRKKFPLPGIGLMEKNARTAGFHGAGAPVDFKLIPGLDEDDLPCTEIPSITATASPPGALDRVDTLEGANFRVVLGAERGVVTVQVSACGVTRNWMLYNSGERDELKNAPVALSGTWAGTYSTTGPGLCGGFNGSWTATFAVDELGNLSGSWSADGFGGTISGTLNGSTLDFNVTGAGDADLTGKVSGSTVKGSFASQPCPAGGGRITGTFQGARTS